MYTRSVLHLKNQKNSKSYPWTGRARLGAPRVTKLYRTSTHHGKHHPSLLTCYASGLGTYQMAHKSIDDEIRCIIQIEWLHPSTLETNAGRSGYHIDGRLPLTGFSHEPTACGAHGTVIVFHSLRTTSAHEQTKYTPWAASPTISDDRMASTESN